MDEMNNNGFEPQQVEPEVINADNTGMAGTPEVEKRAKNAMIIGIVAIVCSFCCTYAGIIVGIVGLVKANGLSALPELSEKRQRKGTNL